MRIQSPWQQLINLFGMCLVGFIASAITIGIVLIISSVFIGFDAAFADENEFITKLSHGLSGIIVLLLPSCWFVKATYGGSIVNNLGMQQPGKKILYGLAVLCFLISFPLQFWLSELNAQIPAAKWMIDIELEFEAKKYATLMEKGVLNVIINIVIIAILPAICEEVFCRGVLQRIFIDLFKSSWLGIIASSVVFAALHLQVHAFLPLTFSGILLGVLYWYSGSLWPGILIHFINNALIIILAVIIPESISYDFTVSWYLVIPSAAILIGLLWYYRRQSPSLVQSPRNG